MCDNYYLIVLKSVIFTLCFVSTFLFFLKKEGTSVALLMVLVLPIGFLAAFFIMLDQYFSNRREYRRSLQKVIDWVEKNKYAPSSNPLFVKEISLQDIGIRLDQLEKSLNKKNKKK